MIISIIVLIFLALVVAINLWAEYDGSRNNKKKRKKFKKHLIGTITFCILVFPFCFLVDKCTGNSDVGEYHNIKTGKKQIQYQNSREQKKDLDDIDKYSKNHPDF
ncbi:MAG: hypothetical protein IKH37_04720 [Prevotella sp.]|nr:hypothetical protein [Prevotella sp.]